ncbi:MAG: 50S ribosomal protein L15 [Planctomycetota bacterium]|nr:50S ribosomal protein L15 [Planctomycetota bacterium]
MKLDEILSRAGRNKPSKRLGRGIRRGKTCGRGHKGAGQRAGRTSMLGYEGGQTPVLARIPKRGFNNADFCRRAYQVVNLCDLEVFDDGDRADPETLGIKHLVRPGGGPVKILGRGELNKKLTVAAQAFSTSAREKILHAGGSVEELTENK